MGSLVSVVELPSFQHAVEGVLSEAEIEDLVMFLAENPDAGALIQGTGGARKLRWGAKGKGKRGGGRTIYYFHSGAMPLYLMDFYTKGAKQDLSGKEKKALRSLIDQLVRDHVPKRKG